MTSFDNSKEAAQVDAAFHYAGLLARAIGYLLVYSIADLYDCGRPILTGVLVGDLLGQAIKVAWNWRYEMLIQLGELLMVGIVFLFVRPMIAWPDDPAMRAILGLAAFGVLTGHVGGNLLTRIGPGDR